MQNLSVGDRVAVGVLDDKWMSEPVFMFSHRDQANLHRFVELHAGTAPHGSEADAHYTIALTPEHYVYRCVPAAHREFANITDGRREAFLFNAPAGGFDAAYVGVTPGAPLSCAISQAALVAPGDVLLVLDIASQKQNLAVKFLPAKVDRVTWALKRGIFNPHTRSGDIVVNGVLASTQSGALRPDLAAMLLAPFEAIYARTGIDTSFGMLEKHNLGAYVPQSLRGPAA
jgi:hypothetical protein